MNEMTTDKLTELTKIRARIDLLAAEIDQQRRIEMRSLPRSYGFRDIRQFIRALRVASGRSPGRRARITFDTTSGSTGRGLAPRGMAKANAAVVVKAAPKSSQWPLTPGEDKLERGEQSLGAYRQMLVSMEAEAFRVLNLPKLPPANWRKWRGFMKRVEELLKTATL